MKKYVSPTIEKLQFSETCVYTEGISLTGNSNDASGTIPENWDYGDD